ncbi:MAG: hypothetical protein N2691_05035 [Patescibacteria group bacterium]|nr:hypothetical protein [Patescibacteria group bacterium]
MTYKNRSVTITNQEKSYEKVMEKKLPQVSTPPRNDGGYLRFDEGRRLRDLAREYVEKISAAKRDKPREDAVYLDAWQAYVTIRQVASYLNPNLFVEYIGRISFEGLGEVQRFTVFLRGLDGLDDLYLKVCTFDVTCALDATGGVSVGQPSYTEMEVADKVLQGLADLASGS